MMDRMHQPAPPGFYVEIVASRAPEQEPRFGQWPCRGCGRTLLGAEHTLVACLRCGAEHLVRDVNATVEPVPRPFDASATPVGRVVAAVRELADGDLMRGFMLGEWPKMLPRRR